MAIATYTDLIKQVRLWSNRKDLTDYELESFSYMAGSMASQLLRVVPMEHTMILDVSSDGHVAIPPDFQKLRSLTWSTGSEKSVPLELRAWDDFVYLRNSGIHHMGARWFARQGPLWFIAPLPEGSGKGQITCHYYRTMPDINPLEQSNWLIDLSPLSYLYGTLHFLYSYVMDEERAEYWRQKFTGELQRLQDINDADEYEGSALTVRKRETEEEFNG